MAHPVFIAAKNEFLLMLWIIWNMLFSFNGSYFSSEVFLLVSILVIGISYCRIVYLLMKTSAGCEMSGWKFRTTAELWEIDSLYLKNDLETLIFMLRCYTFCSRH
jgi:hypothetical protein